MSVLVLLGQHCLEHVRCRARTGKEEDAVPLALPVLVSHDGQSIAFRLDLCETCMLQDVHLVMSGLLE